MGLDRQPGILNFLEAVKDSEVLHLHRIPFLRRDIVYIDIAPHL